MEVSWLDQIHKIEPIMSIEGVWPEFMKTAQEMGFEHVIYTMPNKTNTHFYFIDSAGPHREKDPGFYDPFLK